MRLKTYHAGTVRAALRLARAELGDDAVFVGASEVDEASPTARFRVTFALGGRNGESQTPPPEARDSAGVDDSDGAATAGPAVRRRPHWRKFVPPPLTGEQRRRAEEVRREARLESGLASGDSEPAGLKSAPEPPIDEKGATGPGSPAANRPPGADRSPLDGPPPLDGQFLRDGQFLLGGQFLPDGRSSVPHPAGERTVAAVASDSPGVASGSPSRERPVAPAGAPTAAPPSSGGEGPRNGEWKSFVLEAFHELRAELRQDWTAALRRAAAPPLEPRLEALRNPAAAVWFQRLLAAGAPTGAALDMVAGVADGAPQGADEAAWRARLAERLAGSLCVEPFLGGEAESETPRVALIGPPGSGKSLSAVKLAMQHGLARGRRTRLLRAGEHRVGGGERLDAYAALLDLPLASVDEPSELAAALAALESADPPPELILIDTPGLGAADGERLEALREALAGAAVQTHLVLDATLGSEEFAEAAARFAAFEPDRLLLTRMEAPARPGAVWAEAARLGWPLSFFGSGQQAPEDLRPASADEIVAAVLGER